MDFDDLVATYNLEENLIEVENQLQDLFDENFADSYETGMFPEPDAENEGKFFVSLDIESKKTKLSKDQLESIAQELEQCLLGLLGDTWSDEELKGFKVAFSGVQIFLNGKKLH